MLGSCALFDFHMKLRSSLLSVISGSPDAQQWSWDNTTPNSSTKTHLERIFADAVAKASQFGLYVVYRHTNCGNPRHNRVGNHGFVVEAGELGKLTYQDPSYVWATALTQGDAHRRCPCSSKNNATTHCILQDVIFSRDVDQDVCKRIASIFSDIVEAIDHASNKMPRSGIRENLLRAVLLINDALLPCPMEQFIANGGAFNVRQGEEAA